MPNFKITVWPTDESEREYNPTWECIVEAETIGEAQAEGTSRFHNQFPELDHSKYIVNAGTS